MRRVVRCSRCSDCATVTGIGFASSPRMVCTRTGEEVTEDDGCTMGARGEPRVGVDGLASVCLPGDHNRRGDGYYAL